MASARTYLARPAAFTNAECERLIALASAAGAESAPVHSGTGYAVDPSQRQVHTSLVGRGAAGADWLFDRLDTLFADAGDALGFAVGPVVEDVQILRYETGCHFVAWHTDSGLDRIEQRRLSMSVELSECGDYEGGELEIVPDRVGCVRALPRGGAQIFPSRTLHRVTPVRRGCRWALVAWAGAPGA